VALVACVTQEGLVTDSYQARFNCPDPHVHDLGNGRWEAEGCGHRRDYNCSSEQSFVESKVMCLEMPDRPELVQRIHRSAYGCNEVNVWPVEGAPGIYQAQGCGRTALYQCTTEENQVLCKEHRGKP